MIDKTIIDDWNAEFEDGSKTRICIHCGEHFDV